MNDSPNFSSVLDQPLDTIARPVPLPAGSYIVQTQGIPRFDKSSKKQTEFYEFTLKFLQALDDVDPEELAQIGGLTDKTIKHTFYLTEKSAYRLKEFMIDDLKMDEGDNLRQMVEQSAGHQCIIKIKHVASDDGKSVYSNVASTAPAE